MRQVDAFHRDLSDLYLQLGDIERAAEKLRQRLRDYGALTPENERMVAEAKNRLEKWLSAGIENLRRDSIRQGQGTPSWYPGPLSGDIHWPGLEKYLLERKRWSGDAVQSINQASTDVVSLTGNPLSSDMNVRGLVIGHVQSGKTANMAAVIAKAADRGYRLFIVLAGLTNALRLQTQERFEQDLLERAPHNWERLTRNAQDGDFEKPANGSLAPLESSIRRIAIIKKNGAPLTKLIQTLRDTPRSFRAKTATLVIDDECDQASVNASGKQYDMTRINELVRDLLAELPSCTYVGYTATPFANVLIDPAIPGGTIPEDLYPRNFIKALPLPLGYFGAERLFGRDAVGDDDEPQDDLDMVRTVSDEDVALLQPRNLKSRFEFRPSLAPSLAEAVKYYLIATAVRELRGQGEQHCCMLVHTSVYTVMHEKVADEIKRFLEDVSREVEQKDPEQVEEFRRIWSQESERVRAGDFGHSTAEFGEILGVLPAICRSVQVQIENASSDERLDFTGERRRSIVVGGSVLSRGLTIEGLVVSYFLRTSGQYDTLLQMGRWFGYRFGYEDLPRIWMTAGMARAFRDLASVEAEIREDVAIYAKHDVSPLEFAVRIRQLPGLQITARGKMLAAEQCDVSYSGEHVQTFRFRHQDEEWLESNWNAASDLVDAAIARGQLIQGVGDRRVYGNVPCGTVRDFLRRYRVHETHVQANPDRLIEYIDGQNQKNGALENWHVALIEPAGGTPSRVDLGKSGKVRTVIRARLRESPGDADIKALMSRRDIMVDVPGDIQVADGWETAKRGREEKLKSQGIATAPLLLIYAIDAHSKPRSEKNRLPLEARRDVLAMGVVFPDLGKQSSYVRVKLPGEDEGVEDLEEALEEIVAAGDSDG